MLLEELADKITSIYILCCSGKISPEIVNQQHGHRREENYKWQDSTQNGDIIQSTISNGRPNGLGHGHVITAADIRSSQTRDIHRDNRNHVNKQHVKMPRDSGYKNNR